MSVSDSGFGSRNPFRRNPPGGPSPPPAPAPTPAPPMITSGSATTASSSFIDAPRPPPPHTTFKSAEAAAAAAVGETSAGQADEDRVQIKPRKIVKKVRVQSPPPSSPEDAIPVRSYALDTDSDDSSSTDSRADTTRADPFTSSLPDPEPNSTYSEPPLLRPPPNPFSKTLQDLEQNPPGQDGQAAAGGKGSLDVDSFKRLLLTGDASILGSGGAGSNPGAQQATIQDGASNTDASSISRQSLFDPVQETPRTSHEISDLEESTIAPSSALSRVRSTSGRKPPPPPSSRHGKLIKLELGADSTVHKGPASTISIDTSSPHTAPNRKSSAQSLSQTSTPSSSDINKPLPLPPLRPSGEEDIDSPFDQEAAGKVPESFASPIASPRSPSPSPGLRPRSESQTSTRTTSSAHRKPAAPPPRRHGRTEGRPPSIVSDKAEEDPPRSSIESNRSRADSLRVNVSSEKTLSAPAPPPPRRPNHARQGSSYVSPPGASFAQVSSPVGNDENRPHGAPHGAVKLGLPEQLGAATTSPSQAGPLKISPPPPPPARHSSVRRPSSAHSTADGGSHRRASREKDGGTAAAPPPPPPRARGTSKASLGASDSRNVSGRAGIENEILESDGKSSAMNTAAVDLGGASDIMQQLKALQQEVEAARKVSGSG